MLSVRIQLPSLQIVETRYFGVKASETGSSIRLTGITYIFLIILRQITMTFITVNTYIYIWNVTFSYL